MTEERRLEPITVTVEQAAARLGCPPTTVRRLCKEGRLRHARILRNTIVIAPEWLAGITEADLKDPPPIVHEPRVKAPPPYIGHVVYFIEAPSAGLIKIGTTLFVAGRLKALRTGSPIPLRFLGCIEGDASEEQKLHARFAEYREHGEWFQDVPKLRKFIAGALAARGLPVNG
jgi:excisionase family DNA binding protein